MHGVRGEALIRDREMEEEMDKGKKEEDFDPIMIEEDQIKKIMETTGKMRSGVPYQYKIKNKKRSIATREGLESDEEEVEDLRAMEQIEEILRTTYERNMRGLREGIKGNNYIRINVNVEPINPCETSKPKRTPPFRKTNFKRRKTVVSAYKQGKKNGGATLGSIIQVSTPHRGSSSTFRMVGHDPTIWLPEFRGEEKEDPKKHFFICEKI